MNKEKLKPCPFCGEEAIVTYNGSFGFQVYCSECFMNQIVIYDKKTEEDAIKTWNKRSK